MRESNKSEIVTFDNSTKEITENFLISKVGIDKDGTLFGGLTESEYEKRKQKDSLDVAFLKMRLAEIDLDKYLSLTEEEEDKLSQGIRLLEIVESKSGLDKFEKSKGDTTVFFGQLAHWQKTNLNEVENIEILSAYFLAKVIVRTQDWFVNKYQKDLDVDNLNWCVNLGAPVQYLDSLSNARCEKVLLLARLLCEDEKHLDSLKLPDLQSLCQKLKPQLKEDIQNQNILYKVTSEVGAGAFAYATSNQAQNGYLLYVDIGGGTTEFCYFYYQKQGSNVPEINCQNAFAPILGIEAIINDVQLESKLDQQIIQSQLIDPDTSIVEDLDRLIIKSQKPLKQEVSSGVKIDKNNFDMNGINAKHFHRFAIAFGLSIPKELTLSFKLPSQNSIPPMPPIPDDKPVARVSAKAMTAIRVVTAK